MRLVPAAALALTALPAMAQGVVGTSVVDGRRVELLDDRSWRFVDPEGDGCRVVTARVSFCGDPAVWTPIELDNDAVAAGFRHDDRHYAQYIVEEIGRGDGLSTALMREIVLENAAKAAETRPEDVAVLRVEPAEIDGRTGETMVYVGEIDGFSFVFANTMVLEDDFSMQAISFAVAEDYTEKHMELHAGLVAATRIAE